LLVGEIVRIGNYRGGGFCNLAGVVIHFEIGDILK
jgi:hypothetical protein